MVYNTTSLVIDVDVVRYIAGEKQETVEAL
jgi:hypothetical protein